MEKRIPVNDDCWRSIFQYLDWKTYNNFCLAHPQFLESKCNIIEPFEIRHHEKISSQVENKFHKINEANLYLGCKEIPAHFSKFTSVKILKIVNLAMPANFVTSRHIEKLEVVTEPTFEEYQRGFISPNRTDHIEPILEISSNIQVLKYYEGYLSEISILRLFANNLEILTLADVVITDLGLFKLYLNLAVNLKEINFISNRYNELYECLFSDETIACRERITKLGIFFQRNRFAEWTMFDCENLEEINIFYDTARDLLYIINIILSLPKIKTISIRSLITESFEVEETTYEIIWELCEENEVTLNFYSDNPLLDINDEN